MNTAWTKGFRKGTQEHKDIGEAYASSAFIRKHLIKILQDFENEELSASLKSGNYESPSWALKQADSIGYARALRKIMSILSEK